MKDEVERPGFPVERLVGQPAFRFEVIYGHAEVRSWFEFDGKRLVGMGSKTIYDTEGNVTEHSVKPTGLIGTWS